MGWFSDFTSKPFRTLERTFVPEDKTTRTLLNIGLGAIPGVGPALAAGFGALGASKGSDPLKVLMGGIGGYGLGSIGSGLGNWLTPGGTGFMTDFGQGMSNYFNMDGLGGLYGAGGKAYQGLADLLGIGNAGGSASGAGYLDKLGISKLSGSLSSNPLSLGGGDMLSNNILNTSTGGGLLGFLGNKTKDFNWGSLIPLLMKGGAYLGTEQPEMPSYQDLLNVDYSKSFEPIKGYLDTQRGKNITNLRSQAAEMGALDSSSFINQLAELNNMYDLQGAMMLNELAQGGAKTQYPFLMQNYNTQLGGRNDLLSSIFGDIGDIFNPNPWKNVILNLGQ